MKRKFNFNNALQNIDKNSTELYYCPCCGELFTAEDLEIVTIEESRGEFWGVPCYEDMNYYYCPCCHKHIEEGIEINLHNMQDIQGWIDDNTYNIPLELWLNLDDLGSCVKIEKFDLTELEDVEILIIEYTDRGTIRLDFKSEDALNNYNKGLIY